MNLVLFVLVKCITYYSYALIVYILMSWFPNARETSIGQFLARICEPYLEPFRKIIPPIGMLDISPIVALIALNFASMGVQYLFSFFLMRI